METLIMKNCRKISNERSKKKTFDRPGMFGIWIHKKNKMLNEQLIWMICVYLKKSFERNKSNHMHSFFSLSPWFKNPRLDFSTSSITILVNMYTLNNVNIVLAHVSSETIWFAIVFLFFLFKSKRKQKGKDC